MSRIEAHQAIHGIPLPDATQWDLLKKGAAHIQPVLTALINEAANGDLMHYDGTPNRILEQQAQSKASHTTALISVVNEKKVHLFFTGTSTPATHVDAILSHRTTETPLTAMMDASSTNFPKALRGSLIARFALCFTISIVS
jgi:transposase